MAKGKFLGFASRSRGLEIPENLAPLSMIDACGLLLGAGGLIAGSIPKTALEVF
jgi:hypothetical protein